MAKSAKKSIDLEHLAAMVQRGFEGVKTELAEVRDGVGSVKEDVRILRSDMEAGFATLGVRLSGVLC